MPCCPCFAFASKGNDKAADQPTLAKTAGGKGKGGSKGSRTAAAKEAKKADKLHNKKFEETLQFLEKVPLMKLLPRDQLPIVAANCELQNFSAGANIIKQGDMGHEFFLIQKGEASVYKAENDTKVDKVNELTEGAYFGESSLLSDEPRKATITATSDIECLSITREKFQELGLHNKLYFPKRHAVGMAVRPPVVKKTPTAKSEADRALIAEALRCNEDLQAMVSLDDDRIQRMIDVAWKEEFAEGELIIEENDTDADYFYVIHEGSASVEESDPTSPIRRSKSILSGGSGDRRMEKGDSFGELALLYAMPRSATVRAKEKCTLWVFDRDSFKKVLMRASEEQIKQNMGLLDKVEILDTLSLWEKQQVAEALVEMHFSRGETVLQQGATDTGFYIMREGSVTVSVNGREVRQLDVTLTEGEVQFFGEKALLKNEPRTATVQVISEKAIMFVLDRDTFELVLRPLEDIIRNSRMGRRLTDPFAPAFSDTEQGDGTYELMMQRVSTAKISRLAANAPQTKLRYQKIEPEELRKIGLLGVGGFGSVELLEHKQTGDTYALKVMSKGFIVKQHMQDSIVNEKRILSLMDSNFIIKLYGTYNLQQEIQFLMEPALGGELYSTYHRFRFFGESGHARYYTAGVICAFEYLHERRVVYRDLKPENLLLNELGHLKLTDMGLAKFIVGRTYTTCGTPDYFAPEVIVSAGHNRGVDWWCLGILIFELLSGHPPFESNSVMHIYAKVRSGISRVLFPAKCRGVVEDLIRALLQNNPSDRLPMRQAGIENLKKHPWYVNYKFNWEDHSSGKMEPPYKPKVKSKTDISNFRPRKDDAPPKIDWKDDGSGWDKEF